MIDYFSFSRPQRSVDLSDFGKNQHIKSEAENPLQRTSRQQVLNLPPKSTELQLSCPCHAVRLGEGKVLVRSSPQNQKGELWGPGMAPWEQGQPIPPCTQVLCVNRTGSGWVFKESEMFCLSFQVDLTTTSAAAALRTGAAAKFLIYSSQNTYKRDFYCYTMVQRRKMQLWEGKWLMESRQYHHNIPPAPLCSLEVPTRYSAPLITANLPTLILFRYALTAGIRKLRIIRSLVSVFPHRKEYETPSIISYSTVCLDLLQRPSYNIGLYFVHQRVKAVNWFTLGAVFFK